MPIATAASQRCGSLQPGRSAAGKAHRHSKFLLVHTHYTHSSTVFTFQLLPHPSSFPHAHAVMRMRACACTEGAGYQTTPTVDSCSPRSDGKMKNIDAARVRVRSQQRIAEISLRTINVRPESMYIFSDSPSFFTRSLSPTLAKEENIFFMHS